MEWFVRQPWMTALVVAAVSTLACATAQSAPDNKTCPATDDYQSLAGCEVVDGDLVVEHLDEASLSKLADLRRVEGALAIRQNPELANLDDLRRLEYVGGDFHLVTLPEVEAFAGLEGLRRIDGQLHVVDVGVDECGVEQFVDGLGAGLSGGVETRALDESDGDCPEIEPEEVEPKPASAGTDLPVDELPELDEMRRGELLEDVHPELVDRLRLMYALLENEGIEIVFVSGYRPHENFYDAENRHASWHNLGMAVDLNLAHRDTLDEARRHYEGEDADDWQRIGEIANGLGIIWGEWFDDIFHFEWHPDYHARIRDHEYAEFRRLAGDDLDDHREVWSLFEDGDEEDDADDCSGGCHVIPDDGLRELLEKLR